MKTLNIKTAQIITVSLIVLTITTAFIYNVINNGFTNF